jgi:hypothetical protein
MSRCSSHCRAPIGCPIVHVLVITFLVHVLYLIGRAVHSMCWSHYRARNIVLCPLAVAHHTRILFVALMYARMSLTDTCVDLKVLMMCP